MRYTREARVSIRFESPLLTVEVQTSSERMPVLNSVLLRARHEAVARECSCSRQLPILDPMGSALRALACATVKGSARFGTRVRKPNFLM